MNKAIIILIPLVVIGVLVIGAFGIYNGLVSAQEEAKTAWAQVENQYQRRADLIPNLVETVKGIRIPGKKCARRGNPPAESVGRSATVRRYQ